jgi:secreted trypsin-like serine protease
MGEFCGTPLVQRHFFLPAAHCFFAKYRGTRTWPKQVVVWVGKHNLMDNDAKDAKAHRVNDIIVHEDWGFDSKSLVGDLALLLLDEKVGLSHRFIVGVVCLAPSSSNPFTGNGTIWLGRVGVVNNEQQ